MLRIDFEGIDASGKTTALQFAYDYLTSQGVKVAKLKEVGNPADASCVALRELILSDKNLDPVAFELICAAMRIQNEKWIDQLGDVDILLSDRGLLSHFVYGEANCERDEFHRYLLPIYSESCLPDFTLLFEIDLETSIARRASRGLGDDVIESKGEAYFNKLIHGYDVASFPDRQIIKIDAKQSIGHVQRQVVNALDKISEAS